MELLVTRRKSLQATTRGYSQDRAGATYMTDTRPMGAFHGVLASLERSGKLDGIETGDKLQCTDCKRITYTGRGVRESQICYARIGDLSCLGVLSATMERDAHG